MHLLEQYALSSGLKIDNPFIYYSYYPVPFEKYVTFHISKKDQIRDYDYWLDVIQFVAPLLEARGIKIIQVGTKDDPLVNSSYIVDLRGNTNIRQLAYVIKNSMLHFGIDSFPVHLASYFDKKMVVIYSNTFKECVRPYWGTKDNQKLIETHRNGNKPSFAYVENPKTINLIKPEQITSAILDSLGISNYKSFETLHIGNQYHNFIFELIPDQIVSQDSIPNVSFFIRMDYLFDEKALLHNISYRKCNIITNKRIDINLLKRVRQNIVSVIYKFSEEFDLDFVTDLQSNGIQYKLVCDQDEDGRPDLKIETLDYEPVHFYKQKTKDNLEIKDFSKFKTNKFLLSKGKVYLSEAHLNEGICTEGFDSNTGEVIDKQEFWKDSDFYYFLKEV